MYIYYMHIYTHMCAPHTHMHDEGVRKEKVFPGGSAGKLPVMQEMWVHFLDQEDPLEEEIAICSSILA